MRVRVEAFSASLPAGSVMDGPPARMRVMKLTVQVSKSERVLSPVPAYFAAVL